MFIFYYRSSNWQIFKRFPCQNFPCIPYLPHYEDVIPCESFESNEFIQRIRCLLITTLYSPMCHSASVLTADLLLYHAVWFRRAGGVGGCSLYNRRFHFVCNILISSFCKRNKERKRKMGHVGYGRLYFEDSVATRGAFRRFQSETR